MKLVVEGAVFEMQRIGGISRIYTEILPRLCDLDASLQISLLTCGPLLQPVPTHPNIQHDSLPYWEGLLRPGRLFWRLRRGIRAKVQSTWLEKNQPSIWHSTYYALPVNWPGPVVITVYDLMYDRYPQQFNSNYAAAFRARMRQAINRADAVICISETTKRDVQEFYKIDASKMVVIPLAASSDFEILDRQGLSKIWPRPYLLYIGRRAGYKNFVTLLTAYSQWPQRQQIDLYVVGSPWTSAEKQQLRSLRVANQVHLETAVSDQKLVHLYSQAVAFVHPSLYEGFGLPLLEALSCGCPLVVSDIPTSKEIVESVAIFFNPLDVEQLINALDQVVQNGRSELFLQRAKQITADYSWEKTAQKTLEVYHALA